VSKLLDPILNMPPGLILAIVVALVFLEDAIFIGFFFPGETAAVLAGVGASMGKVPLWVAIIAVVLAAILGDSVGYEVGKKFFGPKVLRGNMLKKHRHRIAEAESFLRRRGGSAVFLGRFTAFFRAMMPALAGASHMPYRTFLAWNAFGGVVWGTGFVLLGWIAGESYHKVEQYVGRGIAVVLVVIVVAALGVWHLRKQRAERRKAETAEPSADPVD
jgi:membrane protein DedA with SNARE-associated domain